jgi:large subunit ribosomal protein L10
MPIRPEKVASVAEIKEKLQNAASVVLVNNLGLDVARTTQLRKAMRQAGVEYKVAKNTLVLRAAKELGIEGLEGLLHGPTNLAISTDHVAAAKALKEFFKGDKAPKIEVKGGILDGKVIDAKAVEGLADLPSREVLLAKVAGGMQAPLAGFAGVAAGVLRKFAYALEARRKQLEEQSA